MKFSLLADKLGICASLVCMVHCMLIPFFFILGFDTLLRSFDQEWVELTLIGTSLVIGLFSFVKGYMLHRQHFVPVLFIAGFLLLINGESIASTWLALCLSVTGALIIVYAHLQNLKLKQSYVTSN